MVIVCSCTCTGTQMTLTYQNNSITTSQNVSRACAFAICLYYSD